MGPHKRTFTDLTNLRRVLWRHGSSAQRQIPHFFAALTSLLACLATSAAITASCNSGAQLVAAMAGTDTVSAVLIGNHIVLKDSDWLGYILPILIERDFVITGPPGRAVTFDLNFVRGKVRMANGTALVFQNVVLVNYRSGSWNQAPGLDLLVPTRENETSLVRMENSAIIFRFCFPLPIAQESTRDHLTRPPQIPGNQSYVLPEQQPANCSSSTSASPLERCYVYTGRYVDVASPAFDVLPSGRLGRSGYFIHCLNTLGLCLDLYPAECIDRLGPIGCVLYTLALNTPPPAPDGNPLDAGGSVAPPPAPLASLGDGAGGEGDGGGGGGDGGSRGKRHLAAVLGSVLGAAAAAVGAALLVRAVVRRRSRRGHGALSRWRHHDKGVADEVPAAAACAGNRACTPQEDTERRSDRSAWGVVTVAGPKQPADGVTDSCTGSCGPGGDLARSLGPPSLRRSTAGGDVAPPAAGGAANQGDDGLLMDGGELAAIDAEGRRGHGRGVASEHAVAFATTTSATAASYVITPATPHRADFHMNIRLATATSATPGSNTTQYGSTTRGDAPTANPAAAAAAAAAGAAAGPAAAADAGGRPREGAAEVGCDVVTLLPVVLGKGGFGRVYEGVYQGSRVAVKVVLESVLDVLVETSVPPPQPPPQPPPPPPQQQLPGHQTPAQQDQQQLLLWQQQEMQHETQQDNQQEPQQAGQKGKRHLAGQQMTGTASPAVAVVCGSREGCTDYVRHTQNAVIRQLSEPGPASGPYDNLYGQQRQQDERQASQGSPTDPGRCEGGMLVADMGCSQQGNSAPAAAVTVAAPPPPPQEARPPPPQEARPPPPQETAPPPEAAPPEPGDVQRSRPHSLLRQFAQEVEVLGRCQHPSVVRLLAACLTPPRLCLVMERMETSLERMIFGGGRDRRRMLVPLPTILHIAIQVSRGLEYLHPTIVHRDLKPANVLINGADSPEPVAKISDFGLARIRAATLPTMHPDAGTPAYLAPECYDLADVVVTHHADMYSLGVMLWVMLTGQVPWKDHNAVAVGVKVAILGQRLPLEQLSDRRCPPKLKQLIWQCWEADPHRRPAAAEMVKELEFLRWQLQKLHRRPPTDKRPPERTTSSGVNPVPPDAAAAAAAAAAGAADGGMPRRSSYDSPAAHGGVNPDPGTGRSPRVAAPARRGSLGGGNGVGGRVGGVDVDIGGGGGGGGGGAAVVGCAAGGIAPSAGGDGVSGALDTPSTTTVSTATTAATTDGPATAATAVTATMAVGPSGRVGATAADMKPGAAAKALGPTLVAAAAAGRALPGAAAIAAPAATATAAGAPAATAATASRAVASIGPATAAATPSTDQGALALDLGPLVWTTSYGEDLGPLLWTTSYGENGRYGITTCRSPDELLRHMSTMSEGTMQHELQDIELEIE